MLHITIVHMEDSIVISNIFECDDDGNKGLLSAFDEKTKTTDLSPLKGHEGEPIMVSHRKYRSDKNSPDFDWINLVENTDFVYKHQKTLKAVGTDENGIQFVEYQ